MHNRLPDRATLEAVRLPDEGVVTFNLPKPVSLWSQANGKRLVHIPAGIQQIPAHLASDPYLAASGAQRVDPPSPVVSVPKEETGEPLAAVEEPQSTTAEPDGSEGAIDGLRLEAGGERGELFEWVDGDNETVTPNSAEPVEAPAEAEAKPAPKKGRGGRKKAS